MTMTDPIADMLTRIRNANTAHFDTVSMPGSKLKESLAAILVEEGYIGGFEVSETPGKPGKTLQITMKYAPDRARTISGIKRVSKPGLRIYARADKIPRARRARCGGGLHLQGPDDRPRGAQEAHGRRGALLCLVATS